MAKAKKKVEAVVEEVKPAAPLKKVEKAPAKKDKILVEAIKLGYYGHKRRYEGDKFFILSGGDFSEIWMKKVEK